MDHPDESMLLAFTLQQPDGWPGGVEQHITQCPICHTCYTEYQRINAVLVNWAHAPAYRTYPAITDSVMQKLHELEPSSGNLTKIIKGVRKGNSGAALPTWHLVGPSIATVAAILCTLVVFALATAYVHRPENSFDYFTVPRSTTVTIRQQRIQLWLTPSVVSTATQKGTSGATSREPYIVVCSSSADVQQSRLRICGYNFKPGSRVSLVIEIQGSRPKVRKPVIVRPDGTMQDWFFVHNCNALPSAIIAQYGNSAVVLTTLENIQFAGCDNGSHTSPSTPHLSGKKRNKGVS